MEVGTQLFSQFPVVSIFFHSFLWYLVIQHLKDFKGSALITLHVPCLETQQIRHLGDHSRGGEPCPEQSTGTLRMTQKRSWNSKRSALFYFPSPPSFYVSLTKLKNTKKKKKKVEYDFPMQLSPSYKPFNSGLCFFHLFTICFFLSSQQWESFKANICYDIISFINISVHMSK